MPFVYIKFCNDSTNEAMSTETDFKTSARLFQVLSDILEGRFYLLNLSHRLIVNEVLY